MAKDLSRIYLIIDIETNKDKHPIFEFGLAVVKDLAVVHRAGSLVKPYEKYDPKNLAYCNIEEAALKKCKFTIDDMVDYIIEVCLEFNPGNNKYKRPLLCNHNMVGFDFAFLYEAFKRCKKNIWDYIGYILIDTLPMTDLIFYNNDKLKDRKLGTLCKFFNIDLSNGHQAEDDAVACAELLITYIKHFSQSFDKHKMMKK